MGHHASRDGKLTPKQARFVDEYLVDLNAKAAAARAGYAVSNPKNADRIGYANLQIPLVQQAIQAKQKRRAGRMEIKADDIAEEIRRVAFADIRDVLSVGDKGVMIKASDEWTREQAAAVGEVSETQHGIKLKMHSKLDALDKLARFLGLYDDRLKVENSGPAPVVQVVFGDEPTPAVPVMGKPPNPVSVVQQEMKAARENDPPA